MKRLDGDPLIDPHDFWVFGYASLMWRPGFDYVDVRAAALPGYRRDMCFLSIHYRGTPEAPGLVCGLMPEADNFCQGRAYRIAPENIDVAVQYLDARELITAIYIPRHLPIRLDDGRNVMARIYIADVTHEQFVGHWSDDEKAAAIVRGIGSEGRSLDYLASVVDHLRELAIDDAHLTELLKKARG
jgi:cation transport protein ChaC